jgi:hypothetical protein
MGAASVGQRSELIASIARWTSLSTRVTDSPPGTFEFETGRFQAVRTRLSSIGDSRPHRCILSTVAVLNNLIIELPRLRNAERRGKPIPLAHAMLESSD